jgi:hypothetical protein
MAIIDLHEQSKKYSCGAACLRNALLVLGTRKREAVLRHAAHTNHAGTSEVNLRQAAERFGYRLDEFAEFDKEKGGAAYRWLVGELRQFTPVLLCVDDFQHWVLAIGILDRKIAIADPAKHERPPFGLYTRGGLLKRWWIVDPDKGEQPQYFGMAVRPETPLAKARARKALRLTEDVLRTLQRDDDTDIHEAAHDLRKVFTGAKLPRRNGNGHIPTGDFLAKYEDVILNAIGYWHSDSDIKLLRPAYQTYKDVAHALDYAVPEKVEKKVLVELTALITGLVYEMH